MDEDEEDDAEVTEVPEDDEVADDDVEDTEAKPDPFAIEEEPI